MSLYEPPHDKTNKMTVRPAKTQICLGIRPVWSVSTLCAQWVAKDWRFLHADSEDSDQSGRMPRLIWVFAERTDHFVGFVMGWLILFQVQEKERTPRVLTKTEQTGRRWLHLNYVTAITVYRVPTVLCHYKTVNYLQGMDKLRKLRVNKANFHFRMQNENAQCLSEYIIFWWNTLYFGGGVF